MSIVTTIYNYFPQVKYKQAREKRKELLTPAHKYMIDILAERLSLEPAEAEEFILDSLSVSCFHEFNAQDLTWQI